MDILYVLAVCPSRNMLFKNREKTLFYQRLIKLHIPYMRTCGIFLCTEVYHLIIKKKMNIINSAKPK